MSSPGSTPTGSGSNSSLGGEPSAEKPERSGALAIGFAVLAAALVKLPALWSATDDVTLRNVPIFVLGVLAGLVPRPRPGGSAPRWRSSRSPLLAPPSWSTPYPFAAGADTLLLTVLHLSIALWLVVGVAYAEGRWRSDRARMDFIRFTGEWVIYLALIALVGRF